MSLQDLLATAPIPGLEAAVVLLTSNNANIQKISVYPGQCEAMEARCVGLILSVHEASEGGVNGMIQALADQLVPVLKDVSWKTKEWADWGPLKCFLQQGDLRDGINVLQRQLDGAILRFSAAMNIELRREYYETPAIQESTRAEFRNSLQAILDDQLEMNKLLAITSPRPVEEVMMYLQTELRDPDTPLEQNKAFRKGLWTLYSKTAKLPPLTDLTGQVELDERHPEFIGTYSDIYPGTWLDKERVAVRLTRTLADSADVHKRFQQEVSLWRSFDHPNVLPLYGIVYLGRHLYSISPWMSNGTAITFVQKWPQANLLKLLSEVAEGLAFLHSKDIVHGDLRGANVLISEDGVARLSDYGLPKFLADCNRGLTTTSSINPRWYAPEILRDKPLSKQSDIWSLGMTFLELLTGQQPFSHILHDFMVQNELSKWKIPNRPNSPTVISAGLNDEMWSLLKRCWKKPESRPSIEEVQASLAHIRGEVSPGASAPKGRFSSLLKGPRQKNSLGVRPNSSDGSSNSSASTRVAPSLKALSINSIQEGHEFSPHTHSRMASQLYSSRLPCPPILPNRRSSNETQPPPNVFLRSKTSFASTNCSNDNPRIEISRASTQELPSRKVSEDESEYERYNPFWQSKNASTFQDSERPRNDVSRAPGPPASTSTYESSHIDSAQVPSASTSTLHESPHVEISRAPKLELQFLESPPSSFKERTDIRAPPLRTSTTGTINTVARSILTVDSTNQDPLLQNAISDQARIVYTNSTGRVVAGTLEGLVDRLVDNFNLRKDEEYREVILTACIDFITPEDLFAMLQWRFDEAEQDTQRHPGDRVATQYNVFMVIMYWLSRRQLPVDAQLLWQMRVFCETAIRMKTSSTMVDIAGEMLQLIDNRPKQDAISRTPLAPGRRMMTADEVTPQGLAIALTLLEGDKFKQIMPCDYLANQCGRPGFNNVDASSSVNNKIIVWVKQSLLHYDALQSRAAVLKFFINTAQECRKLRNYQSLIAIAIALDSAPVQSLELTRKFLSSKMVAQLEELVRLPDPERNHSRYREALKQVIDPAYSDNCIPWIAVHLKELHSVLHLNKRVVQIKGRPLLNLQRYAKFMDRVKHIFSQSPPDLERYRPQGQLAYLEDKLANIRVDEEVDDQIIARGESVKAVEERIGKLRVVERGRLGFYVPKSLGASVTG